MGAHGATAQADAPADWEEINADASPTPRGPATKVNDAIADTGGQFWAKRSANEQSPSREDPRAAGSKAPGARRLPSWIPSQGFPELRARRKKPE